MMRVVSHPAPLSGCLGKMTGFSLVLILTVVQAIIDPTIVTPDHASGLQLNWRTFGDEGRTIDGPGPAEHANSTRHPGSPDSQKDAQVAFNKRFEPCFREPAAGGFLSLTQFL